MKKVVFREHPAAGVPNYVLVEDNQLPGIMKGMQNNVGFWLKHLGAKTPMFVAKGQILFILQPTVQEIPENLIEKRIEAPKNKELDISEEQREENKKRYYSLSKKYETLTKNKQKEEERKKQKAREAQLEKERLGREKAKMDGEVAKEKYGK